MKRDSVLSYTWLDARTTLSAMIPAITGGRTPVDIDARVWRKDVRRLH
jgi:hypothetical protein